MSLSSRRFVATWTNGADLSLDQAVVLASRGRGPRGRLASGWSSLTDGEYRVAVLAAEGLTNHQIAERLFISLGTVKARLSKSYTKLGVEG